MEQQKKDSIWVVEEARSQIPNEGENDSIRHPPRELTNGDDLAMLKNWR
jgi:hypothetical protein